MKRRRHVHGADSYWPGYVDALTNVVLNLLFLIAIFATGVFALGMAAAKRKASAPEVPVQVVQLPISSEEVRIRVAPAEMLGSGRVTLESVRRVDDQSLVQVGFSADAVSITESDRRSLWSQLKPLLLEHPQAQLLLWAVVDVDDASYRRAAYLRVMALRDWLVASGVETGRIHTRLVPGGTDRRSGQVVYVLFQRPASDDGVVQPLVILPR